MTCMMLEEKKQIVGNYTSHNNAPCLLCKVSENPEHVLAPLCLAPSLSCLVTTLLISQLFIFQYR